MGQGIELRARANQRFAYSGRSILVVNVDGAIIGGSTEGFYVEDTRILARERLTADGRPLIPIVASVVAGDSLLAYAQLPEAPGLPRDSVYVEIARTVVEAMRTEIRVQNYHARCTARFELGIELAADFADWNEAESGERMQCAPVSSVWDAETQELTFTYHHPELDRRVAVRVERAPEPPRHIEGTLLLSLELGPRESVEIHLCVEPIFDGERRHAPRQVFDASDRPLGRVRQQLRQEAPRLTTTNATVARAWQTAIGDLASLPLGVAPGPAAPAAGIPGYQRFFGRDVLTISWQALLATQTMLRDSLRLNAAWQGDVIDDWRDEEPGKMLHQARWGPLSILDWDPVRRYYGDYATAPDFLIMLGQYLVWTNDLESVRQLLPAARKALDWLERYADVDGDGFIEYLTRSEKGVRHQGWRDSPGAIVDERGNEVENPIATSELQAYWYAGLQMAAVIFVLTGDRGYALELVRQASHLRRRFNDAFWMEDEGFYALALGPDKRQIRSISSTPGHLLAAGIVPRERATAVARRLLRPDLFSGWGVRTLSSDHPAYNPFSYHLGSVWPVEHGTFALGLARYGRWEELHRLAEGMFALSELFDANRLPETVGGLPRDARHPHPGIYPKSMAIQGWSASMIVMLVQALLGLRPVAPLGLLLVDPHLPPWLPDLRLDGVRVGAAELDLAFWRTAEGETRYRVARRHGRVRVLRQPVPQGPEATIGRRGLAAIRSLLRS